MKAFEYGSGGSTLYFADRVAEVVSVEHDKEWHREVKALLSDNGIVNVRHKLCPPTSTAPDGDAEYDRYRSIRYSDNSAYFYEYAASIDAFDDGRFDVVLVDGRARNACVSHALPKIRKGGWLVLDNSERPDYAPAKLLLAPFQRTAFRGICPYWHDAWETTAWRIA